MLADEIRLLEEQLLRANVRESADRLDALLADDFVEFGSSGTVYSKAQCVSALLAEPVRRSSTAALNDFRTLELSPHIVLATYRLGQSLRSSLWRRESKGWRIVFHQGTRASDGKP
jgi:hypothetical protein